MKAHPRKKINIRKKLRAIKTSFTSIGSNPFTDWQIVFFVSALLILVMLGFSGLTFYRVNNGTLYMVPPKKIAKVTTIDREALTNIIDFFETKAGVYKSLRSQKKIYVDPSL